MKKKTKKYTSKDVLKAYAAKHGFDYDEMISDYVNAPMYDQAVLIMQAGGQPSIEQILAVFAEQNDIPLDELIAQLQQLSEQEQQQVIEEIVAAVQQESQMSQEQMAEEDMIAQLGMPVSNLGLYEYPEQDVIVPTKDGSITMKDIDYPVEAYDAYTNQYLDTMYPEGEYQFDTDMIYEKPLLAQSGYTDAELQSILRAAETKLGDLNVSKISSKKRQDAIKSQYKVINEIVNEIKQLQKARVLATQTDEGALSSTARRLITSLPTTVFSPEQYKQSLNKLVADLNSSLKGLELIRDEKNSLNDLYSNNPTGVGSRATKFDTVGKGIVSAIRNIPDQLGRTLLGDYDLSYGLFPNVDSNMPSLAISTTDETNDNTYIPSYTSPTAYEVPKSTGQALRQSSDSSGRTPTKRSSGLLSGGNEWANQWKSFLSAQGKLDPNKNYTLDELDDIVYNYVTTDGKDYYTNNPFISSSSLQKLLTDGKYGKVHQSFLPPSASTPTTTPSVSRNRFMPDTITEFETPPGLLPRNTEVNADMEIVAGLNKPNREIDIETPRSDLFGNKGTPNTVGNKMSYRVRLNDPVGNVLQATRFARNFRPIDLPYKNSAFELPVEQPLLDPTPGLQQLQQQTANSLANVNTSSPTGLAYASYMKGRAAESALNYINQIEQKNQQIEAQNQTNLIGTINRNNLLEDRYNSLYVDGVSQANAAKDLAIDTGINSIIQQRNRDIELRNQYELLPALFNIENESTFLDRLLGNYRFRGKSPDLVTPIVK